MERRHTTSGLAVTTREDGPSRIEGYGAVFHRADDAGTQYELFDGAVERIGRGAFDRAIDEGHDVRGLFNHDSNQILGRTQAGTMRLSVDDVGLKYSIDLPDTQLARDVIESIERGDISGSSFAFVPTKVEWSEGRDNGPDVRTIQDLQLFDAGPVTFPAYEAATTGIRAEGEIEEIKASREAWRAKRNSEQFAKIFRTQFAEQEAKLDAEGFVQ